MLIPEIYLDLTLNLTDVKRHTDVFVWQELDRGLLQREFSLSSEPVLGQYKISAVSPSLKEEVQFTVSEYVLPKFEVSLVPPAAVVRDAEMTEFKVCFNFIIDKVGSINPFLTLSRALNYL